MWEGLLRSCTLGEKQKQKTINKSRDMRGIKKKISGMPAKHLEVGPTHSNIEKQASQSPNHLRSNRKNDISHFQKPKKVAKKLLLKIHSVEIGVCMCKCFHKLVIDKILFHKTAFLTTHSRICGYFAQFSTTFTVVTSSKTF